MRRKTFDRLLTASGAMLTIVLIVAGSLLTWGSSFISSNVHDQLAAEKIYFPTKAQFAHAKVGTEVTPSMIPSVSQYAGQQLLDGAQAKVFANDFITVHLKEIGGGKTYSQLSAEAIAQPKNAALAGQVQTVFRGETLRGMLLTLYGFWQMGQIAGDAALAAFIMAGIMLVLVALGVLHLRRVPAGAEIWGERPEPSSRAHAASSTAS